MKSFSYTIKKEVTIPEHTVLGADFAPFARHSCHNSLVKLRTPRGRLMKVEKGGRAPARSGEYEIRERGTSEKKGSTTCCGTAYSAASLPAKTNEPY
jgi:hypothetical protein